MEELNLDSDDYFNLMNLISAHIDNNKELNSHVIPYWSTVLEKLRVEYKLSLLGIGE